MAEADFNSILLREPKLKDLNKYRDHAKEWYFLGAGLEVDYKELNKIEEEYSDDAMRMIKMFGVWLENGENPTYWKLINALVDIDRRNIAESLCQQLGKSILCSIFYTPCSNC